MKKKFLCVALSAMMLLPAVPIHAKQNTTINKTFITLPKKNSYTLKIKGTKKKVKWSSSKKKVVAVTKSGKVIAKKSGTAYITAKVNGQTLKCEVSVRSHKSITNKLWDAYDWQCEDIWNNGYCDIYHYIEDGTDSCGNKLNIDKTISDLNKNYKKRNSWNKFVYSVQDLPSHQHNFYNHDEILLAFDNILHFFSCFPNRSDSILPFFHSIKSKA